MFKKLIKDYDLLIAIILPLLCILFVLAPRLEDTNIRILLGLPLVLFLPGYSLIGVLFPRKNDISGIERTAFSFILSIAIVPLLGLILNYTFSGIRLKPVLFALSAFTISVSLVALVRRLKLPTEERFRVPFKRLLNFNLGQSALDKGLFLVLIVSIIVSSATLVYVVVTPKTGERFTEFYLFDPNGTASDYPTDLSIGEEGKVIIGIVNHEFEDVTYHLEVIFNGLLINEENVFLVENEKWESYFTFKATKKGKNQKLEFLLYNDQQKEAYRILHLWIYIT